MLAYAPGVRPGARVGRGQWIGYVGDSGNAETTPPHLHFEMEDPGMRDSRITRPPYRPDRINPYPSLAAAVGRGDGGAGGPLRGVRLGARGAAVQTWQEQLRRTGAGIAADGVFGPATHTATVAFQRAHGLVADGIVGPRTSAAMARTLAAAAPSRAATPLAARGGPRLLRLRTPYLRGADVAEVQRRLGGLAVDGVFGPATATATRAFQRRSGLVVDGIVGPRTRAALGIGAAPAATDGAPARRRLLRLQTPYLRGADVRAWQQRMRDRGWAIAADGVYGPHSADAARQFQERFGLVADGIVGPQTWRAAFGE